MLFSERREAGRALALKLLHYREDGNTVVVGLARGGVVVAYEVAQALRLPLQVVVPRKIGAPQNPELALGSIMEDGEGVFNEAIIQMLAVSPSYIQKEIEKEKEVARRRLVLYQKEIAAADFLGRRVILVDDGIATGSTMQASILAMRKAKAASIVVSAPVAALEAYLELEKLADEMVCLHVSASFGSVGMYYRLFEQVEDEEVLALLHAFSQSRPSKDSHA